MANFAIVIGVDTYANPDWSLTGAVNDALAFTDWVLQDGDVPPANLRLLLSGAPTTPLAYQPAISRNITKVLLEFQQGGGAGGERLFVYYAGHGLSAPGVTQTGGDLEPVLIPADVADLPVDSRLCIPFSQVMPLLTMAPPAEQFFFLDACRDFEFAGHQPAAAPSAGVWTAPSESGLSSEQYVLYATSPGQRAQEDTARGRGVFGETLVAGLRGEPGAAAWNGSNYDIGFVRLAEFVKRRTRARIEAAVPDDWQRYLQEPQFFTRGSRNPVLATIPAHRMRQVEVTLRLSPRAARETCALRLLYPLPDAVVPSKTGTHGPPLKRRSTKLKVPPFNYTLEAEAADYELHRDALAAWDDVVTDVTLQERTAVSRSAAAARGPGGLHVTCDDPSALITVFDQGFRRIRRAAGTVWLEDLDPGIYSVRLSPVEGPPVEQSVEVRPGPDTEVSLAAAGPRLGDEQRKNLAAVGIEEDERGFVRASEALDPLAHARLGTLLAHAAFATVSPTAPGFDSYRSLGVGAGLRPAKGRSGVLVLVGASGAQPAPGVTADAFASRADIQVRNLEGEPLLVDPCEPLPTMPSVAEARLETGPGCLTAELRLPGLAPTRYALAALPDRVTVLIAVAEDTGGVDVQQYLFGNRLETGPSPGMDGRDVRRVDVAQRHYTQGAPLGDLTDLLYGKWLDPLLGALAGYALARTGQLALYIGTPTDGDGVQASAMANMLNFFGGLPDSHVLAGLCEPERRDEHFARALVLGLPVFADGFRALFEWYRGFEGRRARPIWVDPAALIPGSPWTSWVAERPVIAVSAGSLATVPPGWGALERSRDRIERAVGAVGSVHLGGSNVPLSGTAFAVAPGVVMTMEHVCPDGTVDGVSIDFGTAVGEGPRFEVRERLARVGPREGTRVVVLLRTDTKAQDGTPFPPPLRLADAAPEPTEGRRVFVVGYPMHDSHVPPEVQTRVFGDTFGVKRVQPGQLLMVERDLSVLRHDCLTLVGNGGSPVVDLDTGLVLGVHFAGRWLEYKRGDAVPLWPLKAEPALHPYDIWSSLAER